MLVKLRHLPRWWKYKDSWNHHVDEFKLILMNINTLPETNDLPLKIDGWKKILSFLGQKAYFQGRFDSSREGSQGNQTSPNGGGVIKI